jgi:hypothetical protein
VDIEIVEKVRILKGRADKTGTPLLFQDLTRRANRGPSHSMSAAAMPHWARQLAILKVESGFHQEWGAQVTER